MLPVYFCMMPGSPVPLRMLYVLLWYSRSSLTIDWPQSLYIYISTGPCKLLVLMTVLASICCLTKARVPYYNISLLLLDQCSVPTTRVKVVSNDILQSSNPDLSLWVRNSEIICRAVAQDTCWKSAMDEALFNTSKFLLLQTNTTRNSCAIVHSPTSVSKFRLNKDNFKKMLKESCTGINYTYLS